MAEQSYKILINTPTKSLFDFLRSTLVYQKLDLVYLAEVSEVEQYVQRVKPQLVILTVETNPLQQRASLQTIQKLNRIPDLWLLLLLDAGVPMEKLRSSLPGRRIFLQQDSGDLQQIAHNVLTIKDIQNTLAAHALQSRFRQNLNTCLTVIYQEKNLSRVFERLVNYFPKSVDMEYWALFALDKRMRRIEHFAQFTPPTRRKEMLGTQNLKSLAQEWLEEGKSFLMTRKDQPVVFAQMQRWGWAVEQLYFIPLHLKNQVIGGMLIGNSAPQQLNAAEIQFLNDTAEHLSQRILDDNLSTKEKQEISDFSDQLISSYFDEELIFQHACKRLNEMTRAASTIFWQSNKGFGFLFPKFVYFREGKVNENVYEKNMIFLDKENYLSRLIDRGKIQSLESASSDSRLAESTRNVFAKLGYEQLLIIPLNVHEEITGALILNKLQKQDRFNLWDVYKAEEVVKRIQKVIEDARTVKEANLKLKQLARIFELGNEIKLDLELPEILSRITSSLRKTLGWNDIAVLVEDEFGTCMRVITRIGFDKGGQAELNLNHEVTVQQIEEFLRGCEMISNSYLYQPDILSAGQEGQGLTEAPGGEWGDQNLLLVPLITRNRTLGYFIVRDPVDRLKPTIEKIVPLEYYANQAAVAVENSVLYEKLRASQESYRSLAETMSLALVRCDDDSKIVYINPAFERLLGYPAQELLGEKLRTFFAKTSQAALKEMLKQLTDKNIDEKTRLENLEFDVISQSAELIPVSTFGFPFFERRKKTGFFLIMNDLRVLKRLERMKADFNSMIVHDLRSPMNVIQGFIELIRNRVVGEINLEQEELLDIAKENVKKVLTLVDNFLVASKLEVGKFSIEPRLDEINAVIEQQVENHRVLVKNKRIDIQLDLDRNLPLLYFDSLRIDQVINNLLSNAIKFTPENGKIIVRSALQKTRVDGEEKFCACISVQDTGAGIPKNQLAKIFEKYEQIDSNQNLNVRGTGLGLSICREIISLHSGEIWAESDSQAGSTFYFTLPIEPDIEKIVK